ncbi:MAG: CotH kinase family protein [Ignavibacterium sp.]|nr:CotH kinase family protein [Ignavibacterium sp.]
MRKLLLITAISIFTSLKINSQIDQSWKLYDDTHVAKIFINIDPNALTWIYNNVQSDSEHYASIRFKNNWIDEIVDSIGFRLRGNTSRNAKKKSFKISFNTFIRGRSFYGVDKLNLNGEHNDPSIIRSKLCFDQYKKIGHKASRANHVEVYINNKYYGLYISVEHIDDEFLSKHFDDDTGNLWKCLYPADLRYLGSDPNIYKNLKQDGRPVYELTTNESIGDFSKLVKLISLLNNTPISVLADSIESFLDVPGVLKYFAINILTGSWDDYWSLMNNYYLYHHPKEDKFYLIPYDYDNTYGIDWFNINWATANPYNFPKVASGFRPLSERLLQVPEYRNLYTRFLQFFREKVFLLNNWNDRIDSLRAMITNSAMLDTFRTKDYGFTTNDFFNSYSENSYSNQHVKFGLKQFINTRNQTLNSQLNFIQAPPIIYNIEYSPKAPFPNDTIFFKVSGFSSNGISEMSIHFTPYGSTSTIIYPLTFSPNTNSKKVEDADRWIGFIPPLGNISGGSVRIFIKDNFNNQKFYPRKNSIEIRKVITSGSGLVINEFLADNTTIPDPAGEFDDYIEIYNKSNNPILLTGKYLTDKQNNLTKWRFTQPNLVLNPNQYLLVWCDEQQNQSGIHTNFKLSKEGEFIAITESDGISVIDSITFGPQKQDTSYSRFPDGASNWIFTIPTPANSNIPLSVNEEFVPNKIKLSVYPNPFNPSTTVEYSLNKSTNVSIKIYDILGKEIKLLESGFKSIGDYKIIWDGKNNNNQFVGAGIYLVTLTTEDVIKTYKVVLLK